MGGQWGHQKTANFRLGRTRIRILPPPPKHTKHTERECCAPRSSSRALRSGCASSMRGARPSPRRRRASTRRARAPLARSRIRTTQESYRCYLAACWTLASTQTYSSQTIFQARRWKIRRLASRGALPLHSVRRGMVHALQAAHCSFVASGTCPQTFNSRLAVEAPLLSIRCPIQDKRVCCRAPQSPSVFVIQIGAAAAAVHPVAGDTSFLVSTRPMRAQLSLQLVHPL